VGNLTKAVTVRFTEAEFRTLASCAEGSGKCPSEWLRNMAVSWMSMSREVAEIRVAVNTISELLMNAFPEKLPAQFVRRVITEGREHVANQKTTTASGNGSALGEAQR
jgi:hypothetical protein